MQFLFSNQMLDTDRRELRRGGELIALEPQVLAALDLFRARVAAQPINEEPTK